jgi:hypothetical protein
MMLLPFVRGSVIVSTRPTPGRDGPLSLQPSEFLKLSVLLYCANLWPNAGIEMADPSRTLVPVMFVAIVGAGLCWCRATSARRSSWHRSCSSSRSSPVRRWPMAAPPAWAAALSPSWCPARAAGQVHRVPRHRRPQGPPQLPDLPGDDRLAKAVWRAGCRPGKNKLGDFLPLAHSDFIFAVVAEELGMIGVVAVLGGFLILAFCGVQVALATQDRFASLLAGGIVIWFVVQTIINVGGVTGMMPVTGLTLPFFSAGGSSLFVTMTAAGLLLNVARNVR